MKFILPIIILSFSSWATDIQSEIDRTLKVIDHQMTEEELFDSLGMEIPQKERSFPSSEEIQKKIKSDPLIGVIIIAFFASIITAAIATEYR